MKIYTRTGDAGQTGVIGGRVMKDDIRVEAYGTVDELNSLIGAAVSLMTEEQFADLKADLTEIQHELFDCGADLAKLKQDPAKYKVNDAFADRLEALIDKYDEETPDITRFILPGGTLIASSLHVCRTVCRRAERRIVALAQSQGTNESIRKYMNRLSDLLFTVARTANARSGVKDIEYDRSPDVFKDPSA